jgi:hypothetical protein
MAKVPVPHRIGEPQTEADFLANTLPAELTDRLASFLEEAEPLIYSPGTVPDPFSESPEMHVRIGVMTDGEWVWHLAWSDYVKYHRVAPPTAFLDHIASLDYTAPDIGVERAMEIAETEGIPMPE